MSRNEDGFEAQFSSDHGQTWWGRSLSDGALANQPYGTVSQYGPGIYWYRVRAVNEAGVSAWSQHVELGIGEVDLDIDSDNDGVVEGMDYGEDALEDRTDKPGKIIAANDDFAAGFDFDESDGFSYDDEGDRRAARHHCYLHQRAIVRPA